MNMQAMLKQAQNMQKQMMNEQENRTKICILRLTQSEFDALTEFSKEYGCVLALKGRGTVITDGSKTIVNPTGNGALSKGGTGDVLAGITGAYVCQGIDSFEACAAAVYAHGYAADILIHEMSPIGVTATDVVAVLKLLQTR